MWQHFLLKAQNRANRNISEHCVYNCRCSLMSWQVGTGCFFFCLFFSFRCTYVELSLSSILRSEHFGSSIVKFTRYWRPFSCASSISTWIHLAIHNWLRFTAGTTRLMPHFVVDQCTFYPQEFLAQQEPIKYKGPLWYNCNARHP